MCESRRADPGDARSYPKASSIKSTWIKSTWIMVPGCPARRRGAEAHRSRIYRVSSASRQPDRWINDAVSKSRLIDIARSVREMSFGGRAVLKPSWNLPYANAGPVKKQVRGIT